MLIWLIVAKTLTASGYSLHAPSPHTGERSNITKVDVFTIISRSENWHCDLKISNHIYRVELTESWRLNTNHISAPSTIIVATHGITYQLIHEKWQETGLASLSFVKTPYGIDARGSLVLSDGLSWHLRSESGTRNYWVSTESAFEKNLDPLTDNLSTISAPEPWLENRAISTRSLWPSFQDLQYPTEDIENCFADRAVALVGVAADQNYLNSFKSLPAAYLHIADTVNKASRIWEAAFNISLSLSEIVTAHTNNSYVWNWPCDPQINDAASMKQRLVALSRWRKLKRPNDNLATWALFTNCPSADVFGLAWQSSVCTPDSVIIIRRSTLDHRIFAHEMGHSFGAVHDCTLDTCHTKTVCCPRSSAQCDAQSRFIMSPGSNPHQNTFSECSRQNVCAAIRGRHVDTHCLLPKHTTPQIHNPLCSTITDQIAFETCWRDLQCRDFTNSSRARSCGDISRCSLQCEDPDAQKCRDFRVLLLDGTPCGDPRHERGGLCIRGSCHRKHQFVPQKTWMRFVYTLAIVLVGLVLISGVAFVILRYYRRSLTPPLPEISMPQPMVYPAVNPSFTPVPKRARPPDEARPRDTTLSC